MEKIDLRVKAQINGNDVADFEEINYQLEVKNNTAILEEFYIDLAWYDETIENYDYSIALMKQV